MEDKLFTDDEVKQQTRELWKECFHDSDDFLDIYFRDKYDAAANLTTCREGRIVAAVQILPYRMSFYGRNVFSGYVSGLCVHPDFRKQGIASELLQRANRILYRQGATFSFLIPGDGELRKFYEKPEHGAYWTSTYRLEVECKPEGETDSDIEIEQPYEWPHELYHFYRRNSGFPFIFNPSENDFYAALSTCDIEDGFVLTARRRKKLVGLCLAVPSTEGKMIIRSILVKNQKVKDAFLRYLKENGNCTKIVAKVPAPGSMKAAVPYAMARVVCADRLFGNVLAAYPDFQLNIGIDEDRFVPENNGFYDLQNSKIFISDKRPDSVVTPGGLAAMFLSAHPVYTEMMLDE